MHGSIPTQIGHAGHHSDRHTLKLGIFKRVHDYSIDIEVHRGHCRHQQNTDTTTHQISTSIKKDCSVNNQSHSIKDSLCLLQVFLVHISAEYISRWKNYQH